MKSLTKQELINIIEGKRTTERIPNLCQMWMNDLDVFGEREEEMREWLATQPYDVDILWFLMPGSTTGTKEDPNYCWLPAGMEWNISGGLDSCEYIKDWEDTELVERMYAEFPSPYSPSLFWNKEVNHEKYVLGHWFFWLFERHWSLRGMENALTDFYLYPDEVHRFYQRLTDFYIQMLVRAKEAYHIDGVFASDDIGTQTGPFFSLEIFRTFFKPYYKQLIDKAHELGMHFWMHTCGNIELFLPEFIEIGLDVIHPIQKYTMDEKEIAEKFGGQICFLAGFDVQRTIPFGTPDDVRAEVRHLIDTFQRPDGRFMMTMGNGATPDWPKASLEALYDELAKG